LLPAAQQRGVAEHFELLGIDATPHHQQQIGSSATRGDVALGVLVDDRHAFGIEPHEPLAVDVGAVADASSHP
jgi:hypothetical protein